jgi:hypothetical protein
MSVYYLVDLFHELGSDKVIGKTRKDLNKLGDSLPVITKLGKILIDKIGHKYHFLPTERHILLAIILSNSGYFSGAGSKFKNNPLIEFIGRIQKHPPHPNLLIILNLILFIMFGEHTKIKKNLLIRVLLESLEQFGLVVTLYERLVLFVVELVEVEFLLLEAFAEGWDGEQVGREVVVGADIALE